MKPGLPTAPQHSTSEARAPHSPPAQYQQSQGSPQPPSTVPAKPGLPIAPSTVPAKPGLPTAPSTVPAKPGLPTAPPQHSTSEARAPTAPPSAVPEYISEFTTIMEHAHDIRPSDSKSTILASTFIDGIQNPYITNKLRSHNVQNLSELYGLAIKEDQKQRIRDLDFGNTTPQETIAHCDVNAIKGTGCYKCGSNDHYIKNCPLNRDIGNTYVMTDNIMSDSHLGENIN